MFEGSYYWLTGPTFETKIECDYLGLLGMDAVGMSTVPDFLSAASIGVKTLGIAMITDVMDRGEELTGAEVIANAQKAVPVLSELLLAIMKKLPKREDVR